MNNAPILFYKDGLWHKPCPVCNGFVKHKHKSRVLQNRTCSHTCQLKGNSYRKGKSPSNAFKSGDTIGNKNINWKGNSVKYGTIHDWVAYHKGRPKLCEVCKRNDLNRYDWANISGEYKRDLNDWIRLCRKCHFEYDKTRHPRIVNRFV